MGAVSQALTGVGLTLGASALGFAAVKVAADHIGNHKPEAEIK